MISFSFTCSQIGAAFGEQLKFFGHVDTHKWEHHGNWPGHDLPNLEGLKFTWLVETNRSVFEHYRYVKAMTVGGAPPDRVSNLAESWADARGMMWRGADFVEIILAPPAAPGFEAFMMGVMAGGLTLDVYIPFFTFATGDGAPAPTIEAFTDRWEPAFSGEQAAFRSQSKPAQPQAQ